MLDPVKTALDFHKAGQFDKAILLYNRMLNQDPHNVNLLYFLADAYMRIEFNGLGVNLLHNALTLKPDFGEAWCNLGVGYRKEQKREDAKKCWERALALQGDTAEVCSNMAGLYADSSEPHPAIAWCDRALKVDPANIDARFQKSLAILTLQQWDEGWELYETRLQKEGWDCRKTIDVPRWRGGPVDHLYIHGEQGIGDEIMFGSMLPFVDAKRVTIEVNPKVANIIKRTFPEWNVLTKEALQGYTAKVALGSLPGIFKKFHPAPYLKPDPERIAFYRAELEKLGPGPYVALTWLGGMKETRAVDRSLNLRQLEPIRSEFTCVSAQYADTNPLIEPERLEAGLPFITRESTGTDIAEQAALFAAVDAVVTVQQTAVHVAGAVGAACYALIPEKPHWRYGVEGERMPWYDSVRLYRKRTSWEALVQEALADMRRDLTKKAAA